MSFEYPSIASSDDTRAYELLDYALLSMVLLTACHSGIQFFMFVAKLIQKRHCMLSCIREWLGITMSSRLVDRFSTSIFPSLRQIFKDCNVERMVKHAAMRNHSHAEAAKLRCYANTSMSNFILQTGLTEYSISRSLSEEQHNVAGTRLYYHAKDLQMHVSEDILTSQHFIKMTDVDYYVDMPSYLTGNNVIIYTFVPLLASGNTTDGTYTIGNDNALHVHINGGGHYAHQLWDYETDHLMVDHWWGSCFYLLESKNIAPDRKIILLNHVRTIYGPLGWFITGRRLVRRQLCFGGIGYIKSMVKIAKEYVIQHSFSNQDEATCATVTDKQLVAVRCRLKHTKTPTMSDVERIVRMDITVDAHVIAGILFDVLNNPVLSHLIKDNHQHPVTTVELGDNAYTPLGSLVTEDGTRTMRKITEPYMLDSAHPTRSHNSDQSCIQGRIIDVKNPARAVPPFYYQCLAEFAKLLVPDHVANTLVPEDYDFISKQWKRPTQQSLLDKVKHVLFYVKPWAVKSFQKAESYAKVTHPRNISTLPTGFNARLGQYYYPFSSNVMKLAHWYAFGHTPAEIGRALMDKALNTSEVVVDDTTRLDGSCGEFQHIVHKTCVMRAFAPQYKAELSSMLEREANATGFTSTGLHYKATFNTLSGSSDTSTKNSITTAFNHYVERRLCGLKPIAAYQALGMYGGDDGITFDCNPSVLERVYAKTGLLVKTSIIQLGQPVPFLGRVFLDPWTVPNSIADIPRQLRKLHLTATPASVPRDVILLRKAEALLITDPETPILSTWAKRVIELTTHVDSRVKARMEHLLLRDISYWSRFEDPFPPCDNKNLVKSVAETMLPADKISLLENHLNKATSIEGLVLLIDDTPPKVDIDAVVQGLVVTAKPAKHHQQKIRDNIRSKVNTADKRGKNNEQNIAKPRLDKYSDKHPTSRIPIPVSKTTRLTAPTGPAPTTRRGVCKYGVKCRRTKCPFQHNTN